MAITYRIKHHVPGRIKITVPFIKGLSVETLRQFAHITIPEGIDNIRPNPITGSVVITYDPESIDIIKYIEEIAFAMATQKIILTGDKAK